MSRHVWPSVSSGSNSAEETGDSVRAPFWQRFSRFLVAVGAGFCGSISNLTSGIFRVFEYMHLVDGDSLRSMWPASIRISRDQGENPANFLEGCWLGLGGALQLLLAAMVGVLVYPVRGARHGGTLGCLCGLVSGVVGLLFGTIGAALNVIQCIARGIYNSLKAAQVVVLVRPQRVFPADHSVQQYDFGAAQATELLRQGMPCAVASGLLQSVDSTLPLESSDHEQELQWTCHGQWTPTRGLSPGAEGGSSGALHPVARRPRYSASAGLVFGAGTASGIHWLDAVSQAEPTGHVDLMGAKSGEESDGYEECNQMAKAARTAPHSAKVDEHRAPQDYLVSTTDLLICIRRGLPQWVCRRRDILRVDVAEAPPVSSSSSDSFADAPRSTAPAGFKAGARGSWEPAFVFLPTAAATASHAGIRGEERLSNPAAERRLLRLCSSPPGTKSSCWPHSSHVHVPEAVPRPRRQAVSSLDSSCFRRMGRNIHVGAVGRVTHDSASSSPPRSRFAAFLGVMTVRVTVANQLRLPREILVDPQEAYLIYMKEVARQGGDADTVLRRGGKKWSAARSILHQVLIGSEGPTEFSASLTHPRHVSPSHYNCTWSATPTTPFGHAREGQSSCPSFGTMGSLGDSSDNLGICAEADFHRRLRRGRQEEAGRFRPSLKPVGDQVSGQGSALRSTPAGGALITGHPLRAATEAMTRDGTQELQKTVASLARSLFSRSHSRLSRDFKSSHSAKWMDDAAQPPESDEPEHNSGLSSRWAPQRSDGQGEGTSGVGTPTSTSGGREGAAPSLCAVIVSGVDTSAFHEDSNPTTCSLVSAPQGPETGSTRARASSSPREGGAEEALNCAQVERVARRKEQARERNQKSGRRTCDAGGRFQGIREVVLPRRKTTPLDVPPIITFEVKLNNWWTAAEAFSFISNCANKRLT